jgi:hypothetical protein
LAGIWEREEEMEPSPWGPGSTARRRHVSRIDIGGFNLLQNHLLDTEE